MDTNIIILLICSGLIVGFINTLAGGGTIISMTIFMWLGLPINVANGTNRLAIFFQNLTSVANFSKKNLIDWKKGVKIGIPIVIGSILGSTIAAKLDNHIIEQSFMVVLIIILAFILLKPSVWLKGRPEIFDKQIKPHIYVLFLLIGFYGGFIHVGVGYYLLASLVLGVGFDLVKANAMKTLMVFFYIPFSLIVFICSDQINYSYGLIHSIGNVIGATIASQLAIKKGANFIRWILIAVVVVAILNICKIISINEWLTLLIKN